MKLLIVTQKVDSRDPILGFFHRWIEEFGLRWDSVTVITQECGVFHLPSNVRVLSLHKEHGVPRWRQVMRFWQLLLTQQCHYDRVFVHMTPVWVILGAPLWILLRKPVYLWYEIRRGSFKLTWAMHCVRNVFAATKHGLPIPSKKLIVTGHGIDIENFIPNASKWERYQIVSIGRLTRIKNYHVILRAFARLPSLYRLTIAGGTVTNSDEQEQSDIQALSRLLKVASRVTVNWVPPDEVPLLLQRAHLCLHAAQGGLDKAVLESMACGCPVVSSSVAAQEELPSLCQATEDTMAEQASKILELSDDDRQRLGGELRAHVERFHSLQKCIDQITHHMQ